MNTFKHSINSEINQIDGFNRYHQFFLIPDRIDGGLTADFQQFENFEEVKRHLPKIIEELEFFGEWALRLIQVPKSKRVDSDIDFILRNGKEIFEISYMNFNPNTKVFLSNSLIHFYSELIDGEEDWEETDPSINFEINETNITILLNEEIDEVRFSSENYPGDVDLIYRKYYQSP
jgi:hypothetical protein